MPKAEDLNCNHYTTNNSTITTTDILTIPVVYYP